MVKGNVKVSIVILNYMNYAETIKCVDSVLKQKYTNYDILIVDNGSDNESFAILKREYKAASNVYVIHSRENYGFARGNNIGISYAKKYLKAEFVLLLNSDTIMIQDDYIEKMLSEFSYDVGVIGSRIINRNGSEFRFNRDYCEFPATVYFYFYLIATHMGLEGISIYFERLLSKYKRTEILHGCNWLITPAYFEHYNMLFDKTFLYSEENILYIRCAMSGIRQKKAKEAQILHTGKQSSKYLFGNKSDMREKYILSSYKYVVILSFVQFLIGQFRKG